MISGFSVMSIGHGELEHREKYKSPGADWPAFAKKLRPLLGHTIRLWRRRGQWSEATYASRRPLEMGPEQRTATPWKDAHAKRLVKRLRRHRSHLFTFSTSKAFPSTTMWRSGRSDRR